MENVPARYQPRRRCLRRDIVASHSYFPPVVRRTELLTSGDHCQVRRLAFDPPAMPPAGGSRAPALYRSPRPTNDNDLALTQRIDELFMGWPFLGTRRLTTLLRSEGHAINRKRVQRLMRKMGIEEQLLPGLRTLAHAVDQADELLLALGRGTCSSDQPSLSLPMVEAESPPASLPSSAISACSKSPVETPLR